MSLDDEAFGHRVRLALERNQLQEARSLVFHWLDQSFKNLPTTPNRQQLRHEDLWNCLADVVERTHDHHLLELFWQHLDRLRPQLQAPSNALPLLGVPILNRADLLERLLKSLDHPVQTLAIVDNSTGNRDQSDVRTVVDRLQNQGHPLVASVQVARPFGNAGVAASWNMILRAFPGAPVALLVNNDVVLAPGVLAEAIARIAADSPQFLPLLPSPQEFSAFLISAPCWNRLGLFDDGFYPAYLEDLDYRDRLRREPGIDWLEAADLQQAMAASNPISSATINSDPALKSHNRCSFALNRLWYLSHRRLRRDPRGTWMRQWLTEWTD